MTKNRHGLSRYIPLPVRRLVRQKAGFGCIFDGNLVTQYEHFDPEFKDALQHDPDGITLLCPTCHTKKTKGRLTNEMVAAQTSRPAALEAGHAWDSLNWSPNSPLLVGVGSSTFRSPAPVFTAHGIELLKFESPLERGQPFRLSAKFYDSKMRETLQIVENDIQALSSNWDIEQEGRRIVIREDRAQIHLSVVHEPPATFRLERLNMVYKYHHLQLQQDGSVTIDMTDSPIGPHRVGTVANIQGGSGPIGLHIPAAGGFRIGTARPTDSDPINHPTWRFEDFTP